MPTDALRRSVDKLRRELASSRKLDDDTRLTLEHLASDIDDALEQDESAAQSARERLESSALRFEAEHPNLARVLSEVTDALAKIGI